MKFIQKDDTLCIQCKACEKACAEFIFKSLDTDKSSIKINDGTMISGDIINICNQCGKCIEICPELAIFRAKNGVVMIDEDECVGCLMCVGFCPTLSMRINKEQLKPFKCICCGECAKKCPAGAIKVITVKDG